MGNFTNICCLLTFSFMIEKNPPVGEGSWVKNTSSGGEVLTHNWIGRVQLKGQWQYLTDVADASNTWEHLGTLTSL